MVHSLRKVTLMALALPALLAAWPCASGAGGPPKGKPPFGLADLPFTDVDPVMDGMATSNPEWAKARMVPDSFFFDNAARAGFYWFQNRLDWTATAIVSLDSETYSGVTTFVAHDIVGSGDPDNPLSQYRSQDLNDWNSFTFPVPSGEAKIWVFANGDDPDDTDWIDAAEGLDQSPLLGPSPNFLNDVGFIARLNGDPNTDVQWLPGSPEPGDMAWDWEDHHYVFGRSTFGQSFQSTGLDTDPEDAVDHEVYEFCSYRPDSAGPPPYCLWWEEVIIKIDDKLFRFKVLKGQWWLHFWFPPPGFPVGDPTIQERFNLIFSALLAVLGGAPPEAQPFVTEAEQHLQTAYTELLAGNDEPMFKAFQKAYRAMKKARKKGAAIREVEVAVLAALTKQMLEQPLYLDRAGATITNKHLRKSYRAWYQAGRELAKIVEKHGDRSYEQVLKKIRKMVYAAQKGIDDLP